MKKETINNPFKDMSSESLKAMASMDSDAKLICIEENVTVVSKLPVREPIKRTKK